MTIISVRGGSIACLGGGVRALVSPEDFPRARGTSRFPRRRFVFLRRTLATRPPRKPHEMAKQVPAAVIPAGFEAEKRDKLAPVYHAMTEEEMNTPHVCYHITGEF